MEAKLDLGLVRERARGLYGGEDRPSVDPAVFFDLRLVVFVEGIRSERQRILSPRGSGM